MSCPREGEELFHVAAISTTKRVKVGAPQFVGIGAEPGAPGERFAVERSDEVVGGDSGVASVTVRKRVDGDQAVVESNSDFVLFICAVFDPSLGVFYEIADLG